MGNFGEDLRMERLSRGIALEDITAVTKISQRHLVALEQESFACFPAAFSARASCAATPGALGLDQQDWTERFLKAYNASGQMLDDDRSWTAFASNVGKGPHPAPRGRGDSPALGRRHPAAAGVVLRGGFPHRALLRPARRLVAHPAAHSRKPALRFTPFSSPTLFNLDAGPTSDPRSIFPGTVR
jgi:transcriptional regulator with XRE-family HTH domain